MPGKLYFRTRYGSYLRNRAGIKKFAELSMGQLVRGITKKSSFYREMNENLLVEKASLRMRRQELAEQPTLDAGAFFSVRRRLWANNTLVVLVLAAAVTLNIIAVSAFFEASTTFGGVLGWFIPAVTALVLTGGGLLVVERLLDALALLNAEQTHRRTALGMVVLWATLLVGVELVLLGFADVRAGLIAETSESGALYLGFLALVMILPLLGGAIRWDTMRRIDVYRTTLVQREIDTRLAQIDSTLRQNEEYESNAYKMKSLEAWDLLNQFKTFKDNYNEQNGIFEDVSDHFARTYDTFQAEADKRYESDIRDVTAKSIRRLQTPEAPTAGAKIDRLDRMPMPAAPSGDGSGFAPEVENEDSIYLNPRPIH